MQLFINFSILDRTKDRRKSQTTTSKSYVHEDPQPFNYYIKIQISSKMLMDRYGKKGIERLSTILNLNKEQETAGTIPFRNNY